MLLLTSTFASISRKILRYPFFVFFLFLYDAAFPLPSLPRTFSLSRKIRDHRRERSPRFGHIGHGSQGELRLSQVRVRAGAAVRGRQAQPSQVVLWRQLQGQGETFLLLRLCVLFFSFLFFLFGDPIYYLDISNTPEILQIVYPVRRLNAPVEIICCMLLFAGQFGWRVGLDWAGSAVECPGLVCALCAVWQFAGQFGGE